MSFDVLKTMTDRRAAVHRLADELMDRGLFRSCINCDQWLEHNQLCKLYKALPPAETIVTGCEAHSDIIPF